MSMSEFEFLAVLLSIVFGLAMTQLLSGTVRLFYEESIDDVRLAWALSIAIALIINWWGFFRWSDVEQWRFELYAFLMVWATFHYALAAALFPKDFAGRIEPERERKVFLLVFIVFIPIDVAEAGLRHELFSPWYFLPSMTSWILAALVALIVRRRSVERLMAWYMFAPFSSSPSSRVDCYRPDRNSPILAPTVSTSFALESRLAWRAQASGCRPGKLLRSLCRRCELGAFQTNLTGIALDCRLLNWRTRQ